MKYNLLFAILLLFTVNVFSQTISKHQFQEIKKKLSLEKDKAKKAGLLYQAARYYMEKDGKSKTDIDSASLLNIQSINISRGLDLKKNIAQSMLLTGDIETKKGNKRPASQLKKKALDYALKYGLKKESADAYKSIALQMGPSEVPQITAYLKKSISLYKEAGFFYDEAQAFNDLSLLYSHINEPDSCIKYTQKAVKIKKSIKRHNLYKEFTVLAENFGALGNIEKALSYALEAEKIAENENADEESLFQIYNILGVAYSELKFESKSIEYYKKALVIAKKNNITDAVDYITQNAALALYNTGKVDQALDMLLDSGNNYYPGKDCDIRYLSTFLLVYTDLQKYDKAKPYYEQLIKCDKVENISHIEQETVYHAMIHYLLNTGQAKKSYAYIDKLEKTARESNDIRSLCELEKAYYKSDSATGNYAGAMNHLNNYKSIGDSIWSIDNAKQFSDLQLKYETDKKDKNIKLLKEQSDLQKEKIYNATILRHVFIGSLAILILFIALLYNRSRLKQRINKKLELKQQQINDQNDQLKKLLSEKEWLLKEIHHRVKNNLQIVISLLNTQSAYLENKDALAAIQNSQHRMHAMSLIHQKLYQSDNLSAIDMSWYIYELVNYLKESFDLNKKISYKLDNEHVELDVAQAVPLGLILNEAISNAIKYAFKDRDKGKVSISLKNTSMDTYQLIIADDGIGLPEGFESQERESLGMNLMIGLADQLDGTLKLENNNGLNVTVTFTKKRQLTEADENAIN